jgi:hypothetical protein
MIDRAIFAQIKYKLNNNIFGGQRIMMSTAVE